MLHYGKGETHQALSHQLLLSSPQHQQQLHTVLEVLETNQDQGSVRILVDSILQLEQRPIFGEEVFFPVFAAGLVECFYGMVLTICLVNVDTPTQY